MSDTLELAVAARAFEAARELPTLAPEHRSHGLHGHSFRAAVFAALPPDWASFPGNETNALSEALHACVAPLDYGCLNDHLPHPSDDNLTRWLRHHLAVPGIRRIALQSTSDSGTDLGQDGQTQRWRRFHFRAAHRLPRVPEGHPCGRMHGHSFSVVVHVAQALHAPITEHDGPIDKAWQRVAEQLDYQCLNDIPGLENPTSEHLAAWIWTTLAQALPDLVGITVFETPTCGSHFDGAEYRIWKTFSFDSACQIVAAPQGSPRRRLHGHTFSLRLHLHEPLDAVMGWTTDFGEVKARFNPVFQRLDHHDLRELAGLASSDTPQLARWIHTTAQALVPTLKRVDLFEAPGCGTVILNDAAMPMMPL